MPFFQMDSKAKANVSAGMRRSAAARLCPRCERGNALSGTEQRCRYCGFRRGDPLPPHNPEIRDPRSAPRPRDLFRRNMTVRLVVKVHATTVEYLSSVRDGPWKLRQSVRPTWWIWSRRANVVATEWCSPAELDEFIKGAE